MIQLRTAFRQLNKQRLQTTINLLSLTVGLTVAMVLFATLRYEWSFDRQHSDTESIYRIVQHNHTEGSTQYWNTTAYPLAAALRADFPSIQAAQTAGPVSRIISAADATGHIVRFREDRVLFADATYLQLFDFARYFGTPEAMWLEGNRESAFAQTDAVVLTERLADRYFQGALQRGESVLGRTILLNNKDQLTVSGVLRNPPASSSLLFDLLIPYGFFEKNNPYPAHNWSGNYQGTTFIRFAETADHKTWEKEIADWQQKYLKAEDDARIEYRLQPISEIHTESRYGNSPGSYTSSATLLWSLAGMGLFVLLIAVFNFINLATAQIAQRSREVGVRKVLGGTRGQLSLQFLSETFLMTLAGGGLALTCTHVLLRRLNDWMDIVQLQLSFSPELLTFSALLIVLVAIFAGLYPALVMSGFSPLAAFRKQAEERQSKGVNLRRILIVSQFAIVQVLMVCTLVIARQMEFMRSKDLGFQHQAVVSVSVPERDSARLANLAQRLQAIPDIQQMSYASGPPTTNEVAYGTLYRLREEAPAMARSAEMKVVDLNYLSLYGLEMRSGQWLGRAQEASFFNGFVVNETAVKQLGLEPETALGKMLVINEGEAPIIGVIKDFHNNTLQESIGPCILMYWGTGFFNELYLQLHPESATFSQTLTAVEENWRAVFPEQIYHYEFLDETLARNYAVENLTFKAFGTLAGLSIFVGCIGLFGLITFLNERRNKEIGIRKVLGASVAQIAGLLSREMVLLILVAILLASPVAHFFMHRWLQGFAYPIAMQWWFFAVAGIGALGIAGLTVGSRILTTARMNPVEKLRGE